MGLLTDNLPDRLITKLLDRSLDRRSHKSLREWFKHFDSATNGLDCSIDRAVLAGRTSQCMGYAFAAGYQSAIQALFGDEARKLCSLCVSEQHGNHPRAIASTLTQHQQHWRLNGSKTFITGGQEAELLYIACNTGQAENNRPVLKMLKLPTNLPGIQIVNAAALPFIPEISHGAAYFKDVQVESTHILSGDGYQHYIKPFRTFEDIHVFAAVLGFLLGQALESNWQSTHAEVILALILALRSVSQMPIDDASTHVVLAGCRTQMKAMITQIEPEFKALNPEQYLIWERDKALLGIARKAHVKRTEKAWKQF